jgi:hypothetical protein
MRAGISTGRPARRGAHVVGVWFVLLIAALAGAQAARASTVVFSSTDAEQTFTVPVGVTSVHVAAVGGHGGAGSDAEGGAGGFGATATADLTVARGEVLYVEVAGDGTSAGGGGFNGGGAGGAVGSCSGGGGGGGASDVRTLPLSDSATLSSRAVTAAGGGGGGGGMDPTCSLIPVPGGTPAPGGAGGAAGSAGATESGGGGGGGPGTTSMGGTGGLGENGSASGENGALGSGGSGLLRGGCCGGGGGGGGFYGGGGGGDSGLGDAGAGGGGGGGSGFGTGTSNTVIDADTSGTPSVTLTYSIAASPTAAISTPVAGATYALGQVVSSSFTCVEGVGGSGISSCIDQSGHASGAVVDTSTPGQHTYTVTATSQDGLSATANITYAVVAAPTTTTTTPITTTPTTPTPRPVLPVPVHPRITGISATGSTVVWCRGTGCRYPPTRVRFELNRATTVRLVLQTRDHGHWKQVATATLHGHPGLNRDRIAGRWHGRLVPAGPVRILVQIQAGDDWRTAKTIGLTVRHTHQRR